MRNHVITFSACNVTNPSDVMASPGHRCLLEHMLLGDFMYIFCKVWAGFFFVRKCFHLSTLTSKPKHGRLLSHAVHTLDDVPLVMTVFTVVCPLSKALEILFSSPD